MGSVAIDTVRDAAVDASRYAQREAAEIYKKAGEKYVDLLNRAKTATKNYIQQLKIQKDHVLDTLTYGFYSQFKLKEAEECFKNIEQSEVNVYASGILMQYKPRSAKNYIAQNHARLAKEYSKLKGYPYTTIEEARAYWTEIGTGNFGTNRNGEYRKSPAQIMQEWDELTYKKAETFLLSVKSATYQLQASTFLNLSGFCDKSISKLQSRINAILQVDKNIANTEAALEQAKQELRNMQSKEYTYQPSPKVTHDLELLQSSIDTLNKTQQAYLKNLEKVVEKGKVKANEDFTKDIINKMDEISKLELKLDKLAEEKENSDAMIEKLQEKIDAKQKRSSKFMTMANEIHDKMDQNAQELDDLE